MRALLINSAKESCFPFYSLPGNKESNTPVLNVHFSGLFHKTLDIFLDPRSPSELSFHCRIRRLEQWLTHKTHLCCPASLPPIPQMSTYSCSKDPVTIQKDKNFLVGSKVTVNRTSFSGNQIPLQEVPASNIF